MDRKAMVPRSQLIYKDFFTGLISENRRLISDFFYFTIIDFFSENNAKAEAAAARPCRVGYQ